MSQDGVRGIMGSYPAIVKSVGWRNVAQRVSLGIFKYSHGPLKFLLSFTGQLWVGLQWDRPGQKSSHGQQAV